MIECHLVTLDKASGVHPVGIWEIIRLLLAKYVILVTGTTETEACKNINLRTGLLDNIEGAVHATLAEYGKA